MRVSVVTPDRSFFDGEARMITVQAMDGEIGILPKHAPLIARLGHGVARIDAAEGGEQRIAVYGGFVKVQDDVVSVLAGGAATKDEATQESAAKATSEAQSRVEALTQKGAEGAVELPEAQEQLRRAQAFQKLLAT